jgi:hypothetical protein
MGSVLAGWCVSDDFEGRFFAVISVVVEGLIVRIELVNWDHCKQGIA